MLTDRQSRYGRGASIGQGALASSHRKTRSQEQFKYRNHCRQTSGKLTMQQNSGGGVQVKKAARA